MVLPMRRNLYVSTIALLLSILTYGPLQSQHVDPIDADTSLVDFHTLFADTIPQMAQSHSVAYMPPVKVVFAELPQTLLLDQMQCLEATIPMTYNATVKTFIQYFTGRDRRYVAKMLERKDFYFPIYEAQLQKYGLPDELKYLSIVESSLNPRAVSRAKAVGLWQFMAATGRQYDLYQDAYIDERMDLYKATEAACRYLSDLYDMFGDWHLALAAYNCGPGNVRKAIRLAGNKKSFWQIYRFLPMETRAYVPKFIAVNYIMQYAEQYNITTDLITEYIPSDTILVSRRLDMEALARQLEMPFEDLRALNPQVKKNVVPGLKEYSLRIPAEKKEFFTLNRESILDSAAVPVRPAVTMLVASTQEAYPATSEKVKVIHKVKPGDAISKIANTYHVSVASIQRWNRLSSDKIIAGQNLTIWVNPKAVTHTNQPEKNQMFTKSI
jgi:membrane-bound lytic murein transglycosylase D